MPIVMVICVSKNFQSALNELPKQPDPICKVLLPVNDCFIPHLRYFLDAVTVAMPGNIDEISRHQIESIFHVALALTDLSNMPRPWERVICRASAKKKAPVARGKLHANCCLAEGRLVPQGRLPSSDWLVTADAFIVTDRD
jgi:hypothetical protein